MKSMSQQITYEIHVYLNSNYIISELNSKSLIGIDFYSRGAG